MHPTRNTMPERLRIQITEMLQGHLSNSIDLTLQAKQAHWNVKGPDFISLHELFDKVATDSLEFSDLIAERIAQLGGTVEGTIGVVSKRTQLAEYPMAILNGKDHINALSSALASFGDHMRKAIASADELKDHDTADILTQISRSVDKYLWFVESHIQPSSLV
jgi:starvation-inducible DNA-binding protein